MEKSSVLVIEDDAALSEEILSSLGKHFSVTASFTAKEARREIDRCHFDVILLDIHLPDGDGFAVCSHIKAGKADHEPAIIFISGEDDVSRKLMAFEMGADDYLVKPFNSLELRARIESKLRKRSAAGRQQDEFVKGELRFVHGSHQVWVAENAEISLTPIEFRLLLHFAKNQNRVFSRVELLEALWGNATGTFDRTVDAHISKLRKKIVCSEFEILPVRGLGYRFVSKTAH